MADSIFDLNICLLSQITTFTHNLLILFKNYCLCEVLKAHLLFNPIHSICCLVFSHSNNPFSTSHCSSNVLILMISLTNLNSYIDLAL